MRRIKDAKQDEGNEDRERAQYFSRLLGSVIPFIMICTQNGHIFYTVTVALLPTASRTAGAGSRSTSRSHVISSFIKLSATLTLGQQNSPQCFSSSLLNQPDIRLLHQALSLSSGLHSLDQSRSTNKISRVFENTACITDVRQVSSSPPPSLSSLVPATVYPLH
jgi:hypothetical protein